MGFNSPLLKEPTASTENFRQFGDFTFSEAGNLFRLTQNIVKSIIYHGLRSLDDSYDDLAFSLYFEIKRCLEYPMPILVIRIEESTIGIGNDHIFFFFNEFTEVVPSVVGKRTDLQWG